MLEDSYCDHDGHLDVNNSQGVKVFDITTELDRYCMLFKGKSKAICDFI